MTSGVHLDAGYDSQAARDELAARDMTGQIAHKGEKAPIQASQRWHVIHAFFDLADAVITVRSLTRQAWTTYPVGWPPTATTMITHQSVRPLI